jgi:tetratricopeptide (TPR) repeat protein
MDDETRATATLEAFVAQAEASAEDAAEARMLLAALARQDGDLARARRFLADLSPADLVDQDQIIASVNGRIFDGQVADALSVAEAAVADRPDEGDAYVALADALLAADRPEEASAALLRAADLEQYPDAHLLRRARVALAAGDRHGAMAHVRKLLQHYPFGGHLLWFYAQLLETDGDRSTFRADMDSAMGRLHPDARPFDFLVAANRILGDEAQTLAFREQGLTEHCAPMKSGPSAENCRAWYDALAGVDLDRALARIDAALAEDGDRSDFLDTKAMVHLARHEPELAKAAAVQAARMSPDDVYMLWQAERISDIADRDAATSSPATASESR